MVATPLRVLVQGAGIGGLTAAIALAEGMKAVVRVVESRSRLETAHKHEYVGLWSPALRCLHDLGIYPHLRLLPSICMKISREVLQNMPSIARDHMQFVGETSYRSTTGEVLATPQIGLSPFDEHRGGDQSSLGFINKRILMEVLRKVVYLE